MGEWLWHEIYVPTYPNLIASAILGVWTVRRFIRLEKLHKRNHEELKESIHAVRNQGERRQL